MHETFPPSNGVAAGRTAQPILEVDEYRAQHVWIQAVLTHPELQAGGRRNMQRVVMHLAYEVGYDPRLWEYGRCWPLVGTLAEWARLSRGGVQKILRRLEALGILMVTDRRPMSNLYTLYVGVDPWEYCSLVDDGRNDGWASGDALAYYPQRP